MAQDLSNAIPEVWSQECEQEYDEIVVMAGIVSRQYEKDVAVGDTVHVQDFGDLTPQDYVKNQPLTLQDVSVTDDTLLINQQKAIYFPIDRVDEKQSHHNLMEKASKRAAIGMRNVVDTRLLGHYTDALAANVQGSTVSPITLTPDNIFDYFCETGEDLDNEHVIGAERHAVIPPAIRKLITQSPEMRDRGTKMVDENIRNGFMGTFAGFNVHVTTNMATVSSTYPLMFFEKNFINFAEQLTLTEFEKPDGYFIKAAKMLKVYGSKVFNAEAGAVIYAAA